MFHKIKNVEPLSNFILKIIFENNDLKIIQKKINYDKYDVKLYFDLQTSKISNYSLPIFLSVRVNHCIISSAM